MTDFFPHRFAAACTGLFLGLGLVTVQVLIGGTRLLFSLPAYGFIAIAGIFALASLRKAKPAPDVACLISTALFLGYVIGRILLSPGPYVARTDLYIVLGGLVVYGLAATTFTDARSRMVLLGVLLVCGMAHAFVGAIQFRDGNNFMPIPFLRREDYGQRASGFYVCPNHLAGLLEVVAIFGASLVCWSRWPVWSKLLVGYVTAICYAGFILTGSRGGYLSAAASLLVFLFLSLLALRRAGGSLPWKIGGVGLLIVLLAAATVFVSFRKSSLLTQRATTIADVSNIRLDLWKAGFDAWKTSPLWGTGSATYRYYGRMFRTERMQGDPLEAHNDYVQLLAEYGMVGALTFLGFLAFHIRAGWRDFQRLGPKRVAIAPRLLSNNFAVHLGALSALAAYVVHSVFDFNLHIPANALLMAFVFAVLANPGVRGGTEPEAPGVGSLLVRLTVGLLALILLVQCARLLPGEYYAERARTSLRDERTGDAILNALQGLSYEKGNPDLFSYLGRARIGLGYDARNPLVRASFYRGAIEAFESARALAPLEQTYLLTLGLLYDLLSRFPEGEATLERALQLDPRSEYVRQYYQAHLERVQAAADAPAPPAPSEVAPATDQQP